MSQTPTYEPIENMRLASSAESLAPDGTLNGQGLRAPAESTNEALFSAVARWLFENALPFWSRHGVDQTHGGFAEQLRLDGTNPNVGFKRIRVQSRQIYVFSHAEQMGFDRGAEFADHGYRFLVRNAWSGSDGGWMRQLTLEGKPLDETPDLYDHAFVLFSLGWYYRVAGRRDALEWARATADFVETHMRHPSGVGFLVERPAHGPRLQNPHMHLLEASLSAFEASEEERFLRLANEIITIFCHHLFDERTGTLPENFDEGLRPLTSEPGRVVEPGHHFEWAWLLAWYQRITGRDMRSYVRALVGFAERYGVDHRTGAVFDAVRNDGVPLDRGERVWPAAERLQAAVAMFELDGQSPIPVFAQSANRLLKLHLAHIPAGTWIDHVDAGGRPKVSKIPASTLYHLMIAFCELLRIKEATIRAAEIKQLAEGIRF